MKQRQNKIIESKLQTPRPSFTKKLLDSTKNISSLLKTAGLILAVSFLLYPRDSYCEDKKVEPVNNPITVAQILPTSTIAQVTASSKEDKIDWNDPKYKDVYTMDYSELDSAIKQTINNPQWGPFTFVRQEGEQEKTFGVSGVLYKPGFDLEGNLIDLTGSWVALVKEVGGYRLIIDETSHVLVQNISDEKYVGVHYTGLNDNYLEIPQEGNVFMVIPRPNFNVPGVNPNLLVIADIERIHITYYSTKYEKYVTGCIGSDLEDISKYKRAKLYAKYEYLDDGIYTTIFYVQDSKKKPELIFGFSLREGDENLGAAFTRIKY